MTRVRNRPVESEDFAIDLGSLSSISAFEEELVKRPEFHQLMRELETAAGVRSISRRLIRLASERHDTKYLNPYDKAMAAYLYALSFKDLSVASNVASSIAEVPHTNFAYIEAHKLSVGVTDSRDTLDHVSLVRVRESSSPRWNASTIAVEATDIHAVTSLRSLNGELIGSATTATTPTTNNPAVNEPALMSALTITFVRDPQAVLEIS